MTLRNATLFPQALLPLYIFEPRYRRMLADALHSHRMFIVAMQRPGQQREVPSPVAGLGLIRVSVGHRDGTSHLILQGVTRVEMIEAVRYRPYRVQRIRPLAAGKADSVVVDALVSRIRELAAERLAQGVPLPLPPGSDSAATMSADDVQAFLEKIEDPGQLADMVACSLLTRAADRQCLLEAVDVAERLRRLVRFLIAEIPRHRKPENQ